MYQKSIKRVSDILLALISILLLSPIFIITALSIYIYDQGEILFKQNRLGKNKKIFKIFKFRSMPENIGDLPSIKAKNIKITPIGKIIRRTNIDELPQLINILKGDMSIVGPRPSLLSQEKLNELREINGVFECRPGLTGLAQINSYDGMNEDDKVKWDKKYSENISSIGDISIILKTFKYLLKRPPVY